MTWKTRITGIILILAFGLFATVYMRFYVHPKEHAIILFIAPALSPKILSTLYQEDPQTSDQLFSLFNASTIVTSHLTQYQQSSPRELLSSFASGEAIPAGQVGYNAKKEAVDTLLYAAQRKTRTVGIITTTNLGSPGASAFYTHTYEPENLYQNTLQAFDNTHINVVLSADIAIPKPQAPQKPRDVISEAKSIGYRIAQDHKTLFEIPNWPSRLIFGAFGQNRLIYQPSSSQNTRKISLTSLVQRAIQALQYNIGGYFLVIDDHSLLKSQHQQKPLQTLEYAKDLFKAIDNARQYAGENLTLCLYIPYQLSDTTTPYPPHKDSFPSLNKVTDHSNGLFLIHSQELKNVPAFCTVQQLHKILKDKL